MYSDSERIVIGGGYEPNPGTDRRNYGLVIDENMSVGRSSRCEAFENEVLSGEEEEFRVANFEVLGLSCS